MSGTGLALNVSANSTHRLRSEFGSSFDISLALPADRRLLLYARAAWAHEYPRDRSMSAALQALPTSGFVIQGAPPASDAALVSAGTRLALSHSVTLDATFTGEFASSSASYAASAALRVALAPRR